MGFSMHESERWQITDTVHPDRKNIFCLSPGAEHHIGTIVSGSRTKLDRFEAELAMIKAAPKMRRALIDTLDLLRSFEFAQHPEAELLTRRIRAVLGESGLDDPKS